MKEYLKRYQSGAADEKKAKKRTKKKPKPAAAGGGVLIVDEDPVWQKPVQIEEDDLASSGTPAFPFPDPETLNRGAGSGLIGVGLV
jgi:hypothetical protein